MKKVLLLLIILLSSCSFNKIVQHQGIHNLEKKQSNLRINYTNKNEILDILGPPSTKNKFDNDIFIYIERKTSNSKLTKFGKKKLFRNKVLILEIDNRGLLLSKKFFDEKDMNDIEFDNQTTEINYSKKSFVYNFLNSLRQKIDDPLGKKRIKY